MVQEILFGLQKSQWQSQVDLKPWIPRLCSKPERKIQYVALKKYQMNLISHSPVWFVTFMSSGKASRAVKLCFTLPKYYKTFNLS